MSLPLVGNINVKNAVDNIFKSGKIPHAFIIEGDEGTGKKTLCSYMSKSLVCEGKEVPCGLCKQCHLADISSHPDIIFISPKEGKKGISVNQIREDVIPQSITAKQMSRRKVFVITPANRMNEQAQNALLKVLEEPPKDVVFILVTESRTALLDTVISRCITFSLTAPSFEEGFAFLKNRYDAEKVRTALKESENNIGKALILLAGNKENTLLKQAEDFLDLFLENREYELLKLLNSAFKDRTNADEFLNNLETAIYLRARKSLDSQADLVRLNRLYDNIFDYKQLLKTNINLSLLATSIVSKN